jgi:hypothetical protein
MKKILDASRLFEVLNRFRAGYPKQPWAEMGNGAGVPTGQVTQNSLGLKWVMEQGCQGIKIGPFVFESK